ncbi:hypothetical protein QFZ20_002754 [Flavobacterium sp. W4I14]|nr:hypothetical protein [Flavobacterium sp. W4I14]
MIKFYNYVFGKQMQWLVRNSSLAIRYIPDEKSGDNATIGFS